MKKSFLIIITLVFSSFLSFSDIYVKGILHVEGGYRYGHNVPEINAVQEWWFGKNKITFICTGWNLQWSMNTDWRFTLDKEKKRILVINLTNKTYIDISLQKDPLSYVDPANVKVLADLKFDGTVKKQRGNKNFLKKTCIVYHVNEWLMEADLRFYERERTILVTPDVPFNWKLIDELFHWIRSFFNPQPSYVSELKKIYGFIMKSDEVFMPRGGRLKWDFKVLKINSKKAPANIYNIPLNFKKQVKFARRDLTRMRTIIYPWPIY
ncbi:MAG: hypothetical protein KAT17_08535 [Candidatus Aminicenantes bacterium]|nr:hypothetical protein [Candidatus Aminicenantes bacterium]